MDMKAILIGYNMEKEAQAKAGIQPQMQKSAADFSNPEYKQMIGALIAKGYDDSK